MATNKKSSTHSKEKSKSKEEKPEPSAVRILVKRELSDKEIADLARQNSRNALRLGELDAQLSAVKKDYGSKIETMETEVNRINNLVGSGFEMREEDALVMFFPEERIKKFYSRPVPFKEGAVGEFIREEPMQPSDFQRALPLDTGAEAEDGAGATTERPGFEPSVLSDEDAKKLADQAGDQDGE